MSEVVRRRRRRPPVVAVAPDPNRLALTVPECAYLLHAHPNFVWSLIRDGKLESFTLGRKRLVARSAVEALIAGSNHEEAG